LKDKIIKELQQTGRDGIYDLIEFLKESDFFTAPASVKYHLNWKGGLALHSWHVYENYKDLFDKYVNLGLAIHFPLFDSMIIEGLLHDVNKIGKYKIDDEPATDKQINYLNSLYSNYKKKDIFCLSFDVESITKSYASDLIEWLKNNPEDEKPKQKTNYTYKDNNLPLGHGEKSVSIIQDFIDLKDREKLAIRWHMLAFEDGVYNGSKNRDFNRAKDLYPDVQLLQLADYEATFKEQYIPEGSE
jgi:hypothetical protein